MVIKKKNVAVSRICRKTYCISGHSRQSVLMYLSSEIFFLMLETKDVRCWGLIYYYLVLITRGST